MSAYYKYGTTTTTGPWPDVIGKKLMTGKMAEPECYRTVKKGILLSKRVENNPFETRTKKGVT